MNYQRTYLRNYSLKGRVAIVTGASSGNGRAIALALAAEGASVVCSDITPSLRLGGYETSTEPTHELISQTGKAIFQRADVSSEDDVQTLVAITVKTYGRVDMYAHGGSEFYSQR